MELNAPKISKPRRIVLVPALLILGAIPVFFFSVMLFGAGFDLPKCQELGDRCGAVLDPVMYAGLLGVLVSVAMVLAAPAYVAAHIFKLTRSRRRETE